MVLALLKVEMLLVSQHRFSLTDFVVGLGLECFGVLLSCDFVDFGILLLGVINNEHK